ncbi:hypothetical protein [Pseudomonas sp. O39]|uniref:hypothetical protein n=1 Tax=Pseudomonas sp. O39 TaxID=3379130 RepID=UPI00387B78B7
MQIFFAPLFLTSLLIFIFGFLFGQSWDLGWQLPMGVTISIFIATLSLFITIHHFYAVRTHNELQIKPQLIVDRQFNSTLKNGFQTFRVSVKNTGFGPAIIEKYSLSIGGVKILDADSTFVDFLKLVNNLTPDKGKSEVIAMYLSKDEGIDKSSEKILFEVNIPTNGRSFMEGREIARKLAKEIFFTIEYRSHYGRKFETHMNQKTS